MTTVMTIIMTMTMSIFMNTTTTMTTIMTMTTTMSMAMATTMTKHILDKSYKLVVMTTMVMVNDNGHSRGRGYCLAMVVATAMLMVVAIAVMTGLISVARYREDTFWDSPRMPVQTLVVYRSEHGCDQCHKTMIMTKNRTKTMTNIMTIT